MRIRFFLTSFFLLSFLVSALGHGGGLGSDGCHNDSKTGERHCHGDSSSSDSSQSPSSTSGSPSTSSVPSPSRPSLTADSARELCVELGFEFGTSPYENCVLVLLREFGD